MNAVIQTDFVPLAHDFYARHPAIVARELLGKRLIRQSDDGAIIGGRIVEAEAYLSCRDRACHANRGKTRKNATMFGPAGHAYVYMIHARWCLNAVTEEIGQGSAVLIRAIEPLAGIELMQARRGTLKQLDLARGPARLCQALDVTKQLRRLGPDARTRVVDRRRLAMRRKHQHNGRPTHRPLAAHWRHLGPSSPLALFRRRAIRMSAAGDRCRLLKPATQHRRKRRYLIEISSPLGRRRSILLKCLAGLRLLGLLGRSTRLCPCSP